MKQFSEEQCMHHLYPQWRERGRSVFFFSLSLLFIDGLFLAAAVCLCCCVLPLWEQVTSSLQQDNYSSCILYISEHKVLPLSSCFDSFYQQPCSVGVVLLLHTKLCTSTNSGCCTSLSCIFEFVHSRFELAQTSAYKWRAVLSGKLRDREQLAAAAVAGLKQLINTGLLLLPPPPSPPPLPLAPLTLFIYQFSHFHFLTIFKLKMLSSYAPPPFFPSTSGSPWLCAQEGDRKWVSGSAQATGSGWLHTSCNLSPVILIELLRTLQSRLLTTGSPDISKNHNVVC